MPSESRHTGMVDLGQINQQAWTPFRFYRPNRIISADWSDWVCWFAAFNMMTCRLSHSIRRNGWIFDIGGRALTLGLCFFLMNSLKRQTPCMSPVAYRIVRWKMFCRRHQIILRPFSQVHYPGKSSKSKVFSDLFSKTRLMLLWIWRHVAIALYCHIHPPSAYGSPYPPNTPNMPVKQTRMCLH